MKGPIRERVKDMAKAGTDIDTIVKVIPQQIKYELFAGKPLPRRTDKAYHPARKAVYNVAYRYVYIRMNHNPPSKSLEYFK